MVLIACPMQETYLRGFCLLCEVGIIAPAQRRKLGTHQFSQVIVVGGRAKVFEFGASHPLKPIFTLSCVLKQD